MNAHVLPLRFDSSSSTEESAADSGANIEELLRQAETEANGVRTVARGLEQFLSAGTNRRVDSFTMSRSCEPTVLTFGDFSCITELLDNPCMASGGSSSGSSSTPTSSNHVNVQPLLERTNRYMRDASKGLVALENVSAALIDHH